MNDTVRVFIRTADFEAYKKNEPVDCVFHEGDIFYVQLTVDTDFVTHNDNGTNTVQRRLYHGIARRLPL